jgi:hypothetical protein
VSHTCLCIPLKEAFVQLRDFLDSHPSEIVVINLRNDSTPLNLDIGTGNTDIVHALDINDRYYRQEIFDYALEFFGKDKFMDESLTMETCVKDLQLDDKRILLFVQYYSYSTIPYATGSYDYNSWG